jgi:biopolymer transport protein ExbD
MRSGGALRGRDGQLKRREGQLDDEELPLPQLKPTLVALKQSDPEATVVVRGAADVDYQRVITVLDALQQADITKVGLATENTP